MEEDKKVMEEDKKEETISTSIDAILKERERLEKVIEEKFKKEITILFTDICGYTKYMETKGDISGRNMLKKHNDIVFPLVENHKGVVIKTIGDAIMATFDDPLGAIKTGMDIQNDLFEYNRKTPVSDRIHVKIGINTGDALIDEKDVFGDAVNIAARIQTKAGKDEILVSEDLYERYRGNDDVLFRFHDTAELKGKAEPVELYRVIWQDEDIVLGKDPKVRTLEARVEKRVGPPLKVLQLEVTRQEDHIKISAHEQKAGEVSTVIHYEEVPVSIDNIGARCREVADMLNSVNRSGLLTREVLAKLREVGKGLNDELFTDNVKKKINETQSDHLVLNLDDHLVHVPWELLHDGKQFLSQRFNMGRLVKTRQAVMAGRTRLLARPLKILVLADPNGDLKEAYEEGTQIYDSMNKDKKFVTASLRSGDVTPDFIRKKIKNFDLVHYAGHAKYNQDRPGDSGWQLTNGIITAQEIIKMAGTATMPALIFSNACQSARTEEWGIKENFQNEIFGLANAFILSGVKHYIGTFWEVLDEPSRRFAIEFYKNLISGMTTGESVRTARLELIKTYGEESIVWASYLLYGDPTTNYMDQIKSAQAPEFAEETVPVQVPRAVRIEGDARMDAEVIDLAEKKEKKKHMMWLSAAAGVIILAAFFLWGYPRYLKEDLRKYEAAALAYYNGGNFKQALDTCSLLENKNPQMRLIYLIRGNISLTDGKLEAAETYYQKALQVTKGSDVQKAEASIGLGRIASIRKDPDAALNYYQQATTLSPGNSQGYLSQAVLLGNENKYDQALGLLQTAQKLAPNDRAIAALSNEARERAAMINDQEKQARIDKLVEDLLANIDSTPRAMSSDGWTSSPLALWIMDFKTKGYSLQEGEEQLLVTSITDQMLEQSRAQVVERALLDKLLQELKLGTSDLTDRRTALSLGKIVAAKLIISGQIFYSGPQKQISIRLIETETGRITAAITEAFGAAVPATVLTEKLSAALMEKLKAIYPLRGKVSEIKGEEIVLNIGNNAGVKTKDQFKAIDQEVVLEIIAVGTDTSQCRVVSGKDALKKGLRVEII